jgi:Xaa-Pro aminopeptidase
LLCHDSAVCVVASRRCALITNASFDRPREQTWLEEVIVTADNAAVIADLLPAWAGVLGIAGFQALPAPVYIGLKECLPGLAVRDASGLVLALLRECAHITDAGGRAFLESARSGVTEREVLVRVEAALKRAGSEEASFATPW